MTDIDPRILEAVACTVETCANLAEEDEHGDIGKTVANKIRGIMVSRKDPLIGNYMMRDGLTEAEATEVANGVRDLLAG